MDLIAMLITGWIIFIFFVIALLKFVHRKYIHKFGSKGKEKDAPTITSKETSSNKVESSSVKQSTFTATKSKQQLDERHNKESEGTSSNLNKLSSKSISTNNNNNRSDATSVRRKRFEREQFSQSFDLSDKNKGPCQGPDNTVVNYINLCHEWLYCPATLELKEWIDIRENVIDSLNKILRADENPLVASIVDIVFKDEMTLKNCYAECEHEKNVKVTADLDTKLTGVLSLYSPERGTTRHDFFVDRLCGRLNILLDCDEAPVAWIRFDGWPEICVGISNNQKSNQLDSKLSESLAEKLTTSIRNAVFEIDLRRFEDFPTAPQLSPQKKHQESFKSYLVMKIIRGIDIGIVKGCEEPYACVELDNPPQKFQTDCQSGQNPYFGENFVFKLLDNDREGELLFEVFDRVGPRFMGCTLLSIEEIGDNNNNRILPLKSRRMEITDQITGSLEVQFTFLDEKEFLQKSKEIIEKVSPNGNLIKTTKTTFTKPPSAQSEVFAEKVIKEFERNAIPNPNKSTLIIHAVQRVEKKSSDGRYMDPINDDGDKISSTVKDKEAQGEATRDPETALVGQYGEERGRRRTRRGDIFTSIRRRFSKTRSRSVTQDGEEPGRPLSETEPERDVFARSVSVDRESLISGRHLGILGPNSTRSSASELSALSGHSTSTFIHENSTLVIECVENRIRKYYLVPPHLSETGKWKKRGKKLHIYNDHTFTAKHMPSGTPCDVCNGRFPFSLGKQAYQCRDCKMKCHKECHVRATNYCSNTTVYDIELTISLETIKE